MPPLVLSHLSKTYRRRGAEIVALDDLSLQVRDGELLVLVGPSGCGKTTTLRLVAGLEQPNHPTSHPTKHPTNHPTNHPTGHDHPHGVIRLGDRDLAGVKPEHRDVAMVFQHGALYPHLTVAENIGFPLEMRRVPAPERQRRVRETAALLEIGELLSRRPRELSGGERQRVALGRAIVRAPALLLLDEPFAALDPPLRARLRSELRSLHARLGTTTIHVTHDQEDAMALGARLAVLRGGRLRQIGTPEEVYSQPCDRFVASFVGMPPMNMIDGHLDPSGAAPRFCAEGVAIALPAALRSLGGRGCTLGVRATDLRPVGAPRDLGGDLGGELVGEVLQCEPLGDRVDVRLRLSGGQLVVARVAMAERPAPGERLQLRLTRLHLFDVGADGAALAHQDGAA